MASTLFRLIFGGLALFACAQISAQPRVEALDRGLVGVAQPNGKVFLSWRLLASDAPETAFNVYRETLVTSGEDWGDFRSRDNPPSGLERLNGEPLTTVTWFEDPHPRLQFATRYVVRAERDGAESPAAAEIHFEPVPAAQPYHRIPLRTPSGYSPNDASVGDLDGDGQLEIILKQEGRAQDNSRKGVTDPVLLQAYRLDGELLWEIDLGINIRAGAHYTQFIVYDFDGDGRAEVACKTGDGSRDGLGAIIGDADADYRNQDGYIIRGPEYLTVFDGETGAARSTVPYIPSRHPTIAEPNADEMKAVWGDGYGNRMDRFLAGVAYLDGDRPSLIMCRGYYTRSVIAAWDFRDGALVQRWVFDSDASAENRAYRGQGDHSLSIADVDSDGRQEIIYGSMVIDDDGAGLYSTGWGHGDALHVSDLVPDNPGLEVFNIQERFDEQGMNLRDAATGQAIFTVPSVKAATSGGDKGEGPGRGNAVNIDPRFPGAEFWAAGAGMSTAHSASGQPIFEKPPGLPTNFAVWWDGDLQRELLDQNFVLKWNAEAETLETLLVAHASASNNGTKATPALSGDIWGDWREEIIWRSRDNAELRIYTTTIPTPHRMVTLLHDPQYRVALAWQNVGYNQPPHPSFYLGDEAPLPAWPRVSVPPTEISGRLND